jgi:hypothetical protein
MKKLIILGFALALGVSGSFAQAPARYSRTVVDEAGRPLDYFNIIIQNPADSTDVKGETFLGGRLDMANSFSGRKLVRIQSLGYDDVSYIEDFSAPSAPDTIVVRTAPIGLDAVVVSARAPQIVSSGGKTVVRVAGSSLQNLPEVADILRRAPRMSVGEEGITVFGKGTPQVFLDGRESSYEELLLLQPSQLVSIEIDSNPSARYDAAYSSVVRVRSTRAQNSTSGQLSNTSYFGRRYSNQTGAQLQIAGRKWVNYFSYQYQDKSQHDYLHDVEQIHLESNPILDSISYDNLYSPRQHSLLYGSILEINPRHTLSWQYSGEFAQTDLRSLQKERIRQSADRHDLQNIDVDQRSDGKRWSHSANLNWQFAIDSVRSLDITADYARATPRSNQRIARHYLESGADDMVRILNRSTSDILSAKAEYTATLFGADLFTGARYGYLDSRTTTDYNDERNLTLLRSHAVSLYATVGNEYEKWGWEAGLRGEFLNDRVRVDGEQLLDGWQNNLFPSAGIHTTGLSDALDMSLTYTNRIIRPTVTQINPAQAYVNSVVTSKGNPTLISTICHNVEFVMTLWGNLQLTLGGDFDVKPIVETGELSENEEAINYMPINIDRAHVFLVDATYSNGWGPVSVTLNSGVELPRAVIPFLGQTRVIGKPSWYISADTDVKLARNTSLTAGFHYQGRSYDISMITEPMNNLTAGVTQYLFDRRLQLSVSAYDLLRGSRPAWRDSFGFYETSRTGNFDTRYVSFTARWSFNRHTSKYNERGRSEEYDRLN